MSSTLPRRGDFFLHLPYHPVIWVDEDDSARITLYVLALPGTKDSYKISVKKGGNVVEIIYFWPREFMLEDLLLKAHISEAGVPFHARTDDKAVKFRKCLEAKQIAAQAMGGEHGAANEIPLSSAMTVNLNFQVEEQLCGKHVPVEKSLNTWKTKELGFVFVLAIELRGVLKNVKGNSEHLKKYEWNARLQSAPVRAAQAKGYFQQDKQSISFAQAQQSAERRRAHQQTQESAERMRAEQQAQQRAVEERERQEREHKQQEELLRQQQIECEKLAKEIGQLATERQEQRKQLKLLQKAITAKKNELDQHNRQQAAFKRQQEEQRNWLIAEKRQWEDDRKKEHSEHQAEVQRQQEQMNQYQHQQNEQQQFLQKQKEEHELWMKEHEARYNEKLDVLQQKELLIAKREKEQQELIERKKSELMQQEQQLRKNYLEQQQQEKHRQAIFEKKKLELEQQEQKLQKQQHSNEQLLAPRKRKKQLTAEESAHPDDIDSDDIDSGDDSGDDLEDDKFDDNDFDDNDLDLSDDKVSYNNSLNANVSDLKSSNYT